MDDADAGLRPIPGAYADSMADPADLCAYCATTARRTITGTSAGA
jgi:hypothetical protein